METRIPNQEKQDFQKFNNPPPWEKVPNKIRLIKKSEGYKFKNPPPCQPDQKKPTPQS